MTKKTQEKVEQEDTETREQKGVRLALKRMPQLKRVLKRIANLGSYKMREVYVKQMCETIDEWTKECKILLQNHSDGGPQEFSFKK
jgi:hypothetical protein